ncbi:HI1506-related protein [Shewanella psychrotolerans]|uniref:HI1506-related protein n=1 Tax=Shewanella psychrotolerans TaxID=2864206 RepID=UPI001C65494A|nr:HI1506-related protein [Shewanella psychrotolerans]QYK02796.1 Rho termination factor N-terminal domain-containing protein [Shewanella psychrotolerans]
MAKTVSTIQVLLVVCMAQTGYRRAGVALTKGDNHLPLADLSDQQIAAFKADKRLRVSVVDVAPAQGSVELSDGDKTLGIDLTGHIAGVKELDGTPKALDELTVKELKEMAEQMEIADFKPMKKAELVAAISAVQVTVPNEAIVPSNESGE